MDFRKFIDKLGQKVDQKRPISSRVVELSDIEVGKKYKRCPRCSRYYQSDEMVCIADGMILTPTIPPEADGLLHIGELVCDGRYKIAQRIGRGTLTEVYRAVDEQNGITCAVKVLKKELRHDKKTVRRFLNGVEANHRLSHPFIAEMYSQGTSSDQEANHALFVMEWLDGENLSEKIKKEGNLEATKALDISIAACNALEYAHNQGIVHKDLKPSNIFWLKDGQIKLTDFGLAERLLRELDWTQQKGANATGSVYGNPNYLDPHHTKVAPTCDIYSLGCILHECLTGSPPFTGENELQVLFGHMQGHPDKVSKTRPDLKGSGIDEVVQKCLMKEPEKRYQSAQELQDALLTLKSSMKATG